MPASATVEIVFSESRHAQGTVVRYSFPPVALLVLVRLIVAIWFDFLVWTKNPLYSDLRFLVKQR